MITLPVVIRDVMETWPLQLRVSLGSKFYMVSLLEDTEIRRGGRVVTASVLVPGQRITVYGRVSPMAVGGTDSIIADAITVPDG
jgi:hypothetical protein